MAKPSTKRKSSRKKKSSNKLYPIVRKGAIALDGSPDSNALVRVDRALSGRNHRLYRQSRLYTVKVDLDINAPPGTVVDVYALGHSWMAQKAYTMAYGQFIENGKEESAQLKTHRARWNDFRVDHGLGVTFQKDMLFAGAIPGTAGLTKFGTGTEYVMSEVCNVAGVPYTFRWSGSGGNTWNIISEYDITGNTDVTPSTPIGAVAYDGLTDELDDIMSDHLAQDGNEPPYSKDVIEPAVWLKIGTLSVNAAGQQKLSTGFFEAPSGLVVLQSSAPIPNDTSFLNLECKAGDYKGVHAPSMLE